MAYRRTRQQRARRSALGGLSSQPPGRAVNLFALGAAAVEYTPTLAVVAAQTPPPAKLVARRRRLALGGLSSQPPGRPVSMFSLGSLGADPTSTDLTQPTLSQPTVVDPQTTLWQQQMLAQLKGDRTQKWVQIAVTASIPLFGAIWKLIFGAGRD